jgi:hypothetical protein
LHAPRILREFAQLNALGFQLRAGPLAGDTESFAGIRILRVGATCEEGERG